MTKIKHVTIEIGESKKISHLFGECIQAFTEIEAYLDVIITRNVQPKNLSIFNDVILNSSILDFGKKIKIISNINGYNKLIPKLRELGVIRNYFAHCPIITTVDFTQNQKSKDLKKIIIQSLNAEGKLKEKNVYELLKKFEELFNELKHSFDKENLNLLNK